MTINPYAVLLATGALMLATVAFAQSGTAISLLKATMAAMDSPSTDEAKHPDSRLALLDRQPAGRDGTGRTLQN